MATKDFLVHNGRDRKTIEAVGEGLPKLDIETPFAFVVEPVDPVNTGALVVSPEEEKVLWVLDFVGQEEADGLQGLLASVHVVAQKQVV